MSKKKSSVSQSESGGLPVPRHAKHVERPWRARNVTFFVLIVLGCVISALLFVTIYRPTLVSNIPLTVKSVFAYVDVVIVVALVVMIIAMMIPHVGHARDDREDGLR